MRPSAQSIHPAHKMVEQTYPSAHVPSYPCMLVQVRIVRLTAQYMGEQNARQFDSEHKSERVRFHGKDTCANRLSKAHTPSFARDGPARVLFHRHPVLQAHHRRQEHATLDPGGVVRERRGAFALHHLRAVTQASVVCRGVRHLDVVVMDGEGEGVGLPAVPHDRR